MEVMEVTERILKSCFKIYSLVKKVKANKERCSRLAERIKTLETHVMYIRQQKNQHVHALVEVTLLDLSGTLESAEVFIREYTETNRLMRFIKHSSHRDEFDCFNERLKDASDDLSRTLQLEHRDQLHHESEEHRRRTEDELDWKKDDAELKRLLLDSFETVTDQMEKLRIQEVLRSLTDLRNPESTRLIGPEELKCGDPTPFATSSTSDFYKGQYNGLQVVIKKYKESEHIDPSEVESTFKREIATMTQCESPNILQIYGICKQQGSDGSLWPPAGPGPQYLIVMELCERGSLRQVLDSDRVELSWSRKAWMCLHTAKGLYRLHQRETKNRVHGSISSSKFLVTDNFTVKLGGFKLAQTESSLCRTKKDNRKSSVPYCPPEVVNDLDRPYSKECEVYSLGIVLWEIVTRREPFKGWKTSTIMEQVGKQGFKEPIENGCPPALSAVIDSCRAFDGRDRPSAGAVMDKLRIVATELEEEQTLCLQ